MTAARLCALHKAPLTGDRAQNKSHTKHKLDNIGLRAQISNSKAAVDKELGNANDCTLNFKAKNRNACS